MTGAEKPVYLLMKRGLYYMPNNCGYTGIKDHAGRYLASDAEKVSDKFVTSYTVTAIHENDAPEITPGCYYDIAGKYLAEVKAQRDEALAEIVRLREALELALGAMNAEAKHTTNHDIDACYEMVTTHRAVREALSQKEGA